MNTDGIDFVVNPGVYPPSDDTYLLVDTISLAKTDSFLEVGCGAGLVTVAAARFTEDILAIDSSIDAVRNTVENLERNGFYHKVCVFQGDLLTAIRPHSHFTVIAFNPPYLPQDGFKSSVDQATIGGPEGTRVSEHFLLRVVDYLSPNGRVYLVCSTHSNMAKIQSIMETLGFNVRIASSKKLFYEELFVLEGSLL